MESEDIKTRPCSVRVKGGREDDDGILNILRLQLLSVVVFLKDSDILSSLFLAFHFTRLRLLIASNFFEIVLNCLIESKKLAENE